LKYGKAVLTRVCANRILVQDGGYDAFAKSFAETAGAMWILCRLRGNSRH
jgi:hypothetical protein